MPPRSTWKGFLRLSLVSVPVKAYTANATAAEIHLNQLHKACHSRIKYKKTCPIHGEVPNEEIVSGYEYAKGQYVVVDPEELSKLRPANDKAVKIDGFVGADKLDPVYYAGRTYYLVPDGAVGQKPYQLLHHAMVEGDLVALAEVVIAGREQLVLLRPVRELLALSVLAHEGNVKQPEAFTDEVTEAKLTKDEMNLTKTLIQASTLKKFDYSKYRDAYTDKLTQLIQAKVEGEEVVQVPDVEEPKIINLMEALKASVARLQADEAGTPPAARKARPSGKKMAPSARPRASARKKKSG
jgi:DNA end-binding protein Ku